MPSTSSNRPSPSSNRSSTSSNRPSISSNRPSTSSNQLNELTDEFADEFGDIRSEVDRYITAHFGELPDNVLSFWASQETAFPKICRLAKKVFSCRRPPPLMSAAYRI
jgi:hypothetical protein